MQDNGKPFPLDIGSNLYRKKMIDYLFYRFYRLWLCSSIAEAAVLMAILQFSVMLSINALTVWGILIQYGIVGECLSDIQFYILEGSLIVLLGSRFLFKKRYKKVIAKYDDNENKVQRKVGAWVLAIYIVMTFSLLLTEALYRQGKI